MIGRLPEFRPAMSLVALGLVTPRLSHLGAAFEITTKGRLVLAMMANRELPRLHLNIASTRSL